MSVNNYTPISPFQSTPPARGATTVRGFGNIWRRISIHAPREGGDFDNTICERLAAYISIHAPREGGDTEIILHIEQEADFNPRPPRGGRRCARWRLSEPECISIHAPREGGDLLPTSL